MSEQDKAYQRVFKKLGALRQTLTLDERDFLDEIVQGSYSEVEGHVVKVHGLDKRFRGEDDEDEVQAHAMETFDAEKQMQKEMFKQQTFRVAVSEKDVYKVVGP